MAVALLPILVLGAFQANRAFEAQDADQRADLQLAVERTSSTAKARLDSTRGFFAILFRVPFTVFHETPPDRASWAQEMEMIW